MKILCKCGNIIVDQTDYLPYKGYIISDEDWFDILDAMDNAIEDPGITDSDREKYIMEIRTSMANLTTIVWQCNNCGALYIDRGKTLAHFNPADGETAGILRSRQNK